MRGVVTSTRSARAGALAATVTSLVLLVVAISPGVAVAATTATYTATETIPVPPASNYAGSGGGDGWAVALSNTQVFNVFHHDPVLDVVCHNQSDASTCWGPDVITDPSGNNFSTGGQPGLFLDQNTGKLYVYATRQDNTGGVVCVDTTQGATNPNPYCGFTALTNPGEAPTNGSWSELTGPMQVGNHWYSFNYVPGQNVNGTENKLLCFDVSTDAACAGQPFQVGFSSTGTIDYRSPSPGGAAIGTKLIVPVSIGGTGQLACFDDSTQSSCGGSWPATAPANYVGSEGSPFPMVDASGLITGVCLPDGNDDCFALDGSAAATPPGMTNAIGGGSVDWNGPGLQVGARVYVPAWSNIVYCYDAATQTSCDGFPKQFANLSLLYSVNPDPQRPDCIWVNSDNGSAQIQNFDAFSGGTCGQGPIRVLSSSLVVPTQQCTPTGYGSLQVVSPSRSSYSDGSVSFEDFDAHPLGIQDRPLDSTGSVSLNGLNLNANGLPQFLITLNGTQGTPGSVVVTLTWTGIYDPACVKPGTTVNIASGPTQTVGLPGVSTNTPVPQGPTHAALGGSVNPQGLPTTAYFQYGLDSRYTKLGTSGPVYDHQTPAQNEGSDFTSHSISAQLSGLVPNALYHVRLVATNSAGTAFGPDMQFKTPKLPNPGPPTLGRTINVSVVSGIVLVKLNGVFVPLTQLRQVPANTVFNALHGTLRLISAVPGGPGPSHDAAATGKKHKGKGKTKTQIGTFGGAVFKTSQAAGGTNKGLVTVKLLEGVVKGAPSFGVCKRHKAGEATAAALSSRTLALLKAKAKGKFSTSGRYGAATIRGTSWTIADRCDGTLIRDITHSVAVTDFVRHKTIVLHAGQHYLARK